MLNLQWLSQVSLEEATVSDLSLFLLIWGIYNTRFLLFSFPSSSKFFWKTTIFTHIDLRTQRIGQEYHELMTILSSLDDNKEKTKRVLWELVFYGCLISAGQSPRLHWRTWESEIGLQSWSVNLDISRNQWEIVAIKMLFLTLPWHLPLR